METKDLEKDLPKQQTDVIMSDVNSEGKHNTDNASKESVRFIICYQ